MASCSGTRSNMASKNTDDSVAIGGTVNSYEPVAIKGGEGSNSKADSTNAGAATDAPEASTDAAVDSASGAVAMATSSSSVTQRLEEAMQQNSLQMKQMELTSNIDRDFASLMIKHHEGAIALSKIELESGDDAKIRMKAEKLIEKQQKEIASLQPYAQRTVMVSSTDGEATQTLTSVLDDTQSNVEEIEMSGDADHDYAHLMVVHHQDGIELANHQIQFGKSAELKAMAKKMIAEQKKEIVELKTWIKTDSK